MSQRGNPQLLRSRRIDLHCHSRASTEADEATLHALGCPESYSEPLDVYAQAKRRGMEWVTITDHDCISGVKELTHLPNVLVGEELTCYFPQDRCKIHILIWGITQADHDALQACSEDIYAVGAYIATKAIAHAVAHPLYRQNDKLDAWHIQHLLLLFKGFEALNGAHSMAHRAAFEPLLDELGEPEILRLERTHRMESLWPLPWIKTRTGGSDDHGLLNIGRTWTEFPDDVQRPGDLLDCLREARCRPGGEAGSSLKLAHNFYGVAIRYVTRNLSPSSSDLSSTLLRKWVGDKPIAGRLTTARKAAGWYARNRLGRLAKRLGFGKPARGTDLLGQLLSASAMTQFRSESARPVRQAMKEGRAALEEHNPVFDLISGINREVSSGILGVVSDRLKNGELGAIFDGVAAIMAQQALLAPYYFALFHQNQERHLLSRLTRRAPNSPKLRIGLFTDGVDSAGAAGSFAAGLARFASASGVDLTVHSFADKRLIEIPDGDRWKTFEPIERFGAGAGLDLKIPPILDVLEFADRRQYDVLIANTCGPMGLCAWLASKMLRSPLLAILQEDAPGRVFGLTGKDYRLHAATAGFSKWFHGRAGTIMVRSRAGHEAARRLGLQMAATVQLPPTPREVQSSGPIRRWLGIREPVRIVAPADISSRADMELVAAAMKEVCRRRNDAALILVGQGLWTKLLTDGNAVLPVYCLDRKQADELGVVASADLVLCPDTADVCGQFAVDALSAGVPVLAAKSAAAGEFVDDDLTGLVLPAEDAQTWATAILQLLGDEPRRQRMARTARQRSARLVASRSFETLIQTCVNAVERTYIEADTQSPDDDVTLSEASIA